MKKHKPSYSIRTYTEQVSRDPRGICAEEIRVHNADPFVFARRLLKLDQMREDGAGYTRVEVYESYVDGLGWVSDRLVRTVRINRQAREKWSLLGAFQRGVLKRRRVRCTHVGPDALFEQLDQPARDGSVRMRVALSSRFSLLAPGAELSLPARHFRRLVQIGAA